MVALGQLNLFHSWNEPTVLTPPSFDMGGIQSALKKGVEKKKVVSYNPQCQPMLVNKRMIFVKLMIEMIFFMCGTIWEDVQTPCYKSLSRLFCQQTLEMKSKQQINPHQPTL